MVLSVQRPTSVQQPWHVALRQKNTPAGKSRSTAMPRAPGGPTAEMLKATALEVLLKCADAIPCCNLGLTATEFQVGAISWPHDPPHPPTDSFNLSMCPCVLDICICVLGWDSDLPKLAAGERSAGSCMRLLCSKLYRMPDLQKEFVVGTYQVMCRTPLGMSRGASLDSSKPSQEGERQALQSRKVWHLHLPTIALH